MTNKHIFSRNVMLPLAAASLFSTIHSALAGYSDVILADGPVAYYQLNEVSGATTAIDSSPTGDNGVYHYDSASSYPQLGLPWVDGSASAVGFDGNTSDPDSVTFPYQPALATSPFSAECWAQANTIPEDDYDVVLAMFGSYNDPGTSEATGWNFYQTLDDGTGDSFWNLNMRPTPFLTGITPIVPGQWYYLAATFDGTTATLYVNGQAEASDTADGGYTPDTMYDGQIGAEPRTGHGAFDGQVAQVALYSSVLTADQILAHYQAAAGTNTTTTGSLAIAPDGNGNIVLTWPNGTLQSSIDVTGPYSPVLGATSPYTNAPTGLSTFYRFSVP